MDGPRYSKLAPLASVIVMMLGLSVAGAAGAPVEFSEILRLSPEGRLAISPALAVDATGQAHVVWVDKGPDDNAPLHQEPSEAASGSGGQLHGDKASYGAARAAFDNLYHRRFSPLSNANRLSEPVRVNSETGEVWGVSVSKPQIDIGPDGTLHVLFTGRQRLSSGKSSVVARYTRSIDDGQSFEPARTLNSAANNDLSAIMHGGFVAAHAFGTVLAANNGDVHAFWIDTRLMDESDTAGALFSAVSRDGGETFERDRPIFEDLICPCCQVAAGEANAAIFLTSRQTFPGGYRDASIVTSKDQGRSFDAPVRVGEGRWQIEGCPLKRIDVATRGKYVHTASYTSGREPTGVYLSRSIDGGATYENPLLVHAGARIADSPSVVADGQGRVYVVWHAKTVGPRRLFLRVSTDNGQTYSAPIEVPTPEGTAAYPEIAAASDGTAYIAWQQGNAVNLISVMLRQKRLAILNVAK